jgi:hypothetical protein
MGLKRQIAWTRPSLSRQGVCRLYAATFQFTSSLAPAKPIERSASRHLRHASKHAPDAQMCLGDAAITSMLCIGDWLVLAARFLGMDPPALFAHSRSSLAVTVRLGRIEHVLEMRGVVFADRACLDLAYQLVAFVGIGRVIIAKIGVAVLFAQRAAVPSRRHLAGSQSAGIGPSPTWIFSSLFSNCLDACIMLASII